MKPTQEFRNGLRKVAVFEGTAKGKSGKFKSKAVTLQISHKAKNGVFINRKINILRKDLASTVDVLLEAERYFLSKEAIMPSN